MVTGKTQYSLASAQDYFAEHLSAITMTKANV